MAKIISLAEYKTQGAQRAVARYWRSLFNEAYDPGIRLSDMSPKALCFLAEPGDERTAALYSLIIGLSGYNETTTFDSLDSLTQSHILDVHLFLSDQIRFEMMYRLNWLDAVEGNHYPLIRMITDYVAIKQVCQERPPSLSKDHVDYKAFSDLFERDQQVFIRRMMVPALETFKQTYKLK